MYLSMCTHFMCIYVYICVCVMRVRVCSVSFCVVLCRSASFCVVLRRSASFCVVRCHSVSIILCGSVYVSFYYTVVQ